MDINSTTMIWFITINYEFLRSFSQAPKGVLDRWAVWRIENEERLGRKAIGQIAYGTMGQMALIQIAIIQI